MQLSQLVTSLETSQKFRAFGVKQESIFFWVMIESKEYIMSDEQFQDCNEASFICCAFLSAELGELLPLFEVRKKGPDYYRSYSSLLKEDDYFMSDEENMAESMGKLYIHLKENNLV